ncbi:MULTISPECIES: glucan biosynthesis protein G [Rhodopseudomonas]|uniref:Glucans biosynthesis protein G n=1 Tax=Rhodopseudomonas palustris TaxID=1076 RepID=A0A0D7ELY9_RHOPL|nr:MULTISPECIES: glucan biosynthesis protein G [Rhodopseudomonas]KIZ40472.1 glucan biosynthesis protein D [Rhodopseudomonas palustris]MDF3810994.1 glucan biosynthesis protein G [Rhodopseudomonas sp. BAL398]WOK15893.1 glucan biosynthesis protein G [Rhodopseudomonas sp. BAL398]
MNRRQILAGLAAMPLLQSEKFTAQASAAEQSKAFDPSVVRQLARQLAAKPYQAPDSKLPAPLSDLDYDAYRAIRFDPEKALWRSDHLPFEVQFFHRGFFYKNRVTIHEVADGQSRQIPYRPGDFSFGATPPPPTDDDLGFAGFRIHTPLNRPDYYDEVCVFLGASYFRAVSKGEHYGLSARGLSIDTGQSSGEEFPLFKAFWLERPAPGASSMVVHALLDSKSVTGAYRFTIRPGEPTVFDVEMALYPRVDLEHAGLAPMTSMFFFGPNDPSEVPDFRPAVHDSDGLAIYNGRGEELWRPLCNPRDLQVSVFADLNPRGFGLMQREKNFVAYQDLESRFGLRPSLWAEPIGDWSEGAIQLIEIPTKEEVHDNIAAFWAPKTALKAKGEHIYTYRLHWGPDKPKPSSLARFSRTGISARGDDRLFVLDIIGDNLKGIDAKAVRGMVSANTGEIRNVVTQPNPETGGWRLSFDMKPDTPPVELRASLMQGETALSEVWVYRWTP